MRTQTKRTADFLDGPIISKVLLFALPLCIGNILQMAYNTVDTLVIGNFAGMTSLAAMGTSGSPYELLLCIFLGMGSGVSILVSQETGRKNADTLKILCQTTTGFLYLVGIPLSILGFLFGPQLLVFMQVPENVFPAASAYLKIMFLGTIGSLGYNFNAGILQGMGDSRAGLLFLAVSCVINIVLDLLFVAFFHWDTAGAALATILAMYSSWTASVIYTRRHYPELGLSFLPKHIDVAVMKRIVQIGVPLGLNNSIYAVGHILMQSLVNLQGSEFMAANSVAGKVSGMANITINAVASGSTTFAGINYGAGKYQRLAKGSYQITAVAAAISFAASMLFLSFSSPMIRIFTTDEAVIFYANRCLLLSMPWTWMYTILKNLINYTNGIGDVKFPTAVNILMLWVVRLPSAWIISRYFDGTYVAAATSISFAAGASAMVIYFLFSKRWKEIRRRAQSERRGEKA